MLLVSRFLMLLKHAPTRRAAKSAAIAAYFAFLLISLFGVAFEATLPPIDHSRGPEQDRRWFLGLFGGFHTLFVNPVITVLGIASFFAQAHDILAGPAIGALSITGLALQAVTFAAVGISWIYRLTIPSHYLRKPPADAFAIWYEHVGWAATDNLVFAVVQAILFLLAAVRARRQGDLPETTPLLP
jgi:hypothetical protein